MNVRTRSQEIIAFLVVLSMVMSAVALLDSTVVDGDVDDSRIYGTGHSDSMDLTYYNGHIFIEPLVKFQEDLPVKVFVNGEFQTDSKIGSKFAVPANLEKDNNYNVSVIGSNLNLNAVLEVKLQYLITSSAGDNGSISPSGNTYVNEGSNPTFTISPNSGYHISGLTVDGESVSITSSYVFENVIDKHTISATFAKNSPPGPGPGPGPDPGPVDVTIVASAGEGGSISPEGDVKVDAGKDVVFTITPDKGYIISDVKVDGKSVGKVSSYTFFKVAANSSISATFEKSDLPTPEEVPTSEKIETDLKDKDNVEYFVDENTMKDENSSVVSTDVLKDIPAGKSVTFTVMKDNVVEYAITFSADSTYVPDSKSIDLRIDGDEKSTTEVEEAAKNVGSDKSFYLDLKASGPLPKDTTIVYHLGEGYASGDVVNLYYYNPETKQMEDQKQTLVVDDKLNVSFTISHASIYSVLKMQDAPADNTMLYVIIAIVVIAIIAALAYFLMRSKNA